MPDNRDSVMVVIDHPSGAVPQGWTHFPADAIIARRVLWVDYRRTFLINKKIVLIDVFQFNASSASPFKTEYSGNDDYGIEHDVVSSSILCARHNISGGGAGTTRAEHKDGVSAGGAGGSVSESWGANVAQVPLLGVVMRDAAPSAAKLAAAQALTTDSVVAG